MMSFRYSIALICCVAVCGIALAGDDPFYKQVHELAYEPGYKMGNNDKVDRRSFEPARRLQEAYVQKYITRLQEIYSGEYGNSQVVRETFNEAFWEGWKSGYTDAYRGKVKRYTQFEFEREQEK